jgi:hypothetical protein
MNVVELSTFWRACIEALGISKRLQMGVFFIAMSGLNVQTLVSIMMHTVIRVGNFNGLQNA